MNTKMCVALKTKNEKSKIDDLENEILYNDIFTLPSAQRIRETDNKKWLKVQTILKQLREKNAQLSMEVCQQKQLNEKLVSNFYSLLTTARQELVKKNTKIDLYRRERQASFLVKCKKCNHKFDIGKSKPEKPRYIRVLKSRCLLEVSFRKYEELAAWVTATGLVRNSDNLPTLPEMVEQELALKTLKPSLKNTNSLLAPANQLI